MLIWSHVFTGDAILKVVVQYLFLFFLNSFLFLLFWILKVVPYFETVAKLHWIYYLARHSSAQRTQCTKVKFCQTNLLPGITFNLSSWKRSLMLPFSFIHTEFKCCLVEWLLGIMRRLIKTIFNVYISYYYY